MRADPAGRRRTRIWDISSHLHCSVIGTCLTVSEIRHLLIKLGETDAQTASDHVLHGRAVRLAGRHDLAAKLLNKALDRRHERLIKLFAKACSCDAVKALWLKALDDGELSGAYWAVLTHPATSTALVQEAFGEIHMLSHMVGSSSRVDLARLRRQEKEIAARDEKAARQEARLQAAARERAALLTRIERLDIELKRQAVVNERPMPVPEDAAFFRRKVEEEKARTVDLAKRLSESDSALRASERLLQAAALREAALRQELADVEHHLGRVDDTASGEPFRGDLHGRTILYVGGRPGQVERLRALADRLGGTLLVHDGGIEDNAFLLPGLVSQAHAALFPVDCISHHAAGQVKKLCREGGKPFWPLRSASLASFVAALRREDLFERESVVFGEASAV